MALEKEQVLHRTNNGLDVFKHFLSPGFEKENKAFKSPFYNDTKASCYIYKDKKSAVYKYTDFGNSDYNGDCFFIVGKFYNLDCKNKADFIEILKIIDAKLGLFLEDNQEKINRITKQLPDKVTRAINLKSIHDEYETAEIDKPIEIQNFTDSEIIFWNKYGISKSTLNEFDVVSVKKFIGKNKDNKTYILENSEKTPIYGYQGKKHTKLYMPFSNLRFLYVGEKTENYIFGLDKLPTRGDIVFITGGEKDVLSLYSHGFNAICMNSETAHIPVKLLRSLSFRFKHITLLYDVDKTGLKSMKKLSDEHKKFKLTYLKLPLNGKEHKDISDFFMLGFTAQNLRMLFKEMLDEVYNETLSIMKSCMIDFKNPPVAPEPLISINDVTVGTPGNIMCVAGNEGSGKTNFLGGIISGSIKDKESIVDTLGVQVRENDNKGVIIYDTEQSEHQLYKNITYILKRAQLKSPPTWFKAFGLVGISRGDRMKMIFETMDRFFYEYEGIQLVIIDGIADLLSSVNDEEASVQLVEELFRLSAIYNTVIICVLHLTPSGMKLRGHLGSEIQRKSAGILLVEKDNDKNCSTIKAIKVRDGSPLDVPIIEFGWDTEKGRHVFLGERGEVSSFQRKYDELKELAFNIFLNNQQLIKSTDLQQKLMDSLSIKDRMARNHIKFMIDNDIIKKSDFGKGYYNLSD